MKKQVPTEKLKCRRGAVTATDSEFVRALQTFRTAETKHIAYACDQIPKLEPGLARWQVEARIELDELSVNTGACDLYEMSDEVEQLLRPVAEWTRKNQEIVIAVGGVGAALLAAGPAITAFGVASGAAASAVGGSETVATLRPNRHGRASSCTRVAGSAAALIEGGT